MTKRVEFVTAISGMDFTYASGQKRLIDAPLADAWIASGICIAAPEAVETPKVIDAPKAFESKKEKS